MANRAQRRIKSARQGTVNKALILERARQIEKFKNGVSEAVPNVYACFALALTDKKYGWTQEQIEELFADTQWLWQKCTENGITMPEWCLEHTGIDVISETTAEKRGLM